jgi:uncharacterized repeat protein (TIGR03803 family)
MKALRTVLGALAIAPALTCAAAGTPFAVLHSFNPAAGEGREPMAGVIRDGSGHLYGTTYMGGKGGNGTVFRATLNGNLSVLHSFGGGSDGLYPTSSLFLQNGLQLFGTTLDGGNANGGTVFKLTTAGRETIFHLFDNDSGGYGPQAGVIGDQAGNLYGTNQVGGAAGKGTVYKLGPKGKETALHAFSGNDGANPDSVLVMDQAGNLYGTTPMGGTAGFGVVFKIAAGGAFSVLHAFTGPASDGGDGSYPSGGLTLDSAGNLYGTTLKGGLYDDYGTVFKVTPQGHETVLHIFYGPLERGDGANPVSQLVIDSAGNLYGTTLAGGDIPACSQGSPGCGMVFKLTPSGTMTSLHAFTGSDGYSPSGPLAVDSVYSKLYGTTESGGAFGAGVIFRVKE